MEKEWITKISKVIPGNCFIRGYLHSEIIENLSYSAALFLTLRGRLATDREEEMLDSILNALTEHQFESGTVTTARHIVSGNPQLIPGIAGALLVIGQHTTQPQDAADLINSAVGLMEKEGLEMGEAAKKIVEGYRKAKKRFPGFGHPIHKEGDYRAISLRKVAERLGFVGEKVAMYEAIHKEFLRATCKTKIPINVDGMMACIMLEMGFEPIEMTGISAVSVLPGILAHAIEEIKEGKLIRHPPLEMTAYIGEDERHLPPEKLKM
jgi:citrate synthase